MTVKIIFYDFQLLNELFIIIITFKVSIEFNNIYEWLHSLLLRLIYDYFYDYWVFWIFF